MTLDDTEFEVVAFSICEDDGCTAVDVRSIVSELDSIGEVLVNVSICVEILVSVCPISRDAVSCARSLTIDVRLLAMDESSSTDEVVTCVDCTIFAVTNSTTS